MDNYKIGIGGKIEQSDLELLSETICESIDLESEKEFLDIMHRETFGKPINEKYLDFADDCYTFYCFVGKDDRHSKYLSVVKTLKKMSKDKFENKSNE